MLLPLSATQEKPMHDSPVKHLNCGEMRPLSERLANGAGSLWRRGRAVCHCLLVETPRDGLVLVDTGYGEDDLLDPRQLGLDLAVLLKPLQDTTFTAIRQVKAWGYDPRDVRHVIVTHLDTDHRGGLADFPNATIHVSSAELDSALRPASRWDRRRYGGDWHHDLDFAPHDATGETWMGLPVIHALEGTAGRVLQVLLPGHSRGHTGVAVEMPEGSGPRWLLHAGDAVQNAHEFLPGGSVPWGINLFNTVMQSDRRERLASRERVREISRRADVRVVCAHDPHLLPTHLTAPRATR